jgi:ABC-type antimicrobial peptide transport system permease subunit
MGKKSQTLIIFITILLILLFETTGLLIHSAALAAEEDAYRQIGINIAVTNKQTQSNDKTIITNDMLNNLVAKDHVVGYDSLLEIFCTPKNFTNVKIYTGVNPATQNDTSNDSLEAIKISKDQISLSGGVNIEYNERFYKNQNVLIEGQYPDWDHKGAIISKQLADANGLEIGDVLSFICDETQNTTDIEIIGIYQTHLKFEILDTNNAGEGVFHSSPYNIIYINYDTVNLLKNNVCPIINLSIWVDSPQYIQTVMDEITSDEVWRNFSVYNITEIIYNDYAQQLIATGKMSKDIVTLSLLFGGIILIITMSFFGNSYMYEMGLYTVLGLIRPRVMLIQILQAFIIVFTACLVSLALSPIITTILNNVIKVNYIFVMNDSIMYNYYTGDIDILTNFHVSIQPEVLIQIAVALVIITVVSTIIPFLATMCIKPREILAGNKKG